MRAETELRPSPPVKQQVPNRKESRPGVQVRRWRERERPEPSVVWQSLAIAFGGFAFAVGLSALTLAEDVGVRSSELWTAAGGLALAAFLCVAAHRDVNRGRISKEREVEEIEP